jgi:hypothetical protein
VGLNVDAFPRLVDAGRVNLRLTLELSGVLSRDAATDPKPASFRHARSELELMLDSGKPVDITQTFDGETGTEYSIQITATVQK